MEVGITEFKKNMGKYLDLALTNDVFITKNGKVTAKIVTTRFNSEAAEEEIFNKVKQI